LDFETVYNTKVEKCSHETAFNKVEAEKLWTLAQTLTGDDYVVEIGVEFGRSTTILGYCALANCFNFVAIDAWVGEYSPKAKQHILNILQGEWCLPINLWSLSSYEAAKIYNKPISLIHIDGGHEYEEVLQDCTLWLPKVKKGGYACFDDYGHDSLPGVFAAVQDYMKYHTEWEFLGRFGNKLGVFRNK